MKNSIINFTRPFLLAAFVVPVSTESKWTLLTYSNIKPNKVEFSSEGLRVGVDSSASPLVLKLDNKVEVQRITIKGQFFGKLRLPDGVSQGSAKGDDYRLRIGLVVPGDKKLGLMQRLVAADWVKELFKLAPKGVGMSHIQFFNMSEKSDQIGRERTHPLSDLIKEKTVWAQEGEGSFSFSHELKEPVKAVALWLSVDGDDLKQKYQVLIERLTLE